MDEGVSFPKVSVRRLPLVDAAPIPAGGGQLMTEAGMLTQVVNGDHIQLVVLLEFRADAEHLRGNHVHYQKREMLYLISGRLRGEYLDLDTGSRYHLDVRPGDLVTVDPRCAHAYAPLEDSLALDLSSLPYDSSDTIPYCLTEDSAG